MKKLLLIVLITSGFTINAQTKQNDATWEETVEFLKENIGKFSKTLHSTNAKTKQFSVPFKTNYEIVNGKIGNTQTGGYIWQASLSDLVEAVIKENDGGSIVLYFTKNAVTVSVPVDNGGYEEQKRNDFPISFCVKETIQNYKVSCNKSQWNTNDSEVQRTLKAFKHLAYLANQKRKKSKF